MKDLTTEEYYARLHKIKDATDGIAIKELIEMVSNRSTPTLHSEIVALVKTAHSIEYLIDSTMPGVGSMVDAKKTLRTYFKNIVKRCALLAELENDLFLRGGEGDREE